MRDEIGPVAAFKDVSVVPALPKTRSGKILRKTMRQIADGEAPAVPRDDRGRGRSRHDSDARRDDGPDGVARLGVTCLVWVVGVLLR